jgi:hypothetical protein
MRFQTRWVATAAAVASLVSGAALASGALDASLALQKQITRAAADSQKTVDNLAEQKADMAGEYKALLQRIDSLKVYNAQLRDMVKNQTSEMGVIKQQIASVDETEKGVAPLMLQMVDTLDQFVKLDIPFLPEERAKRVQKLRTNLQRADITTAEKYRQILEAYTVEMDYGNSIEAYQGQVGSEGNERTVDFLRWGRLALIYQTLDGHDTFAWDNEAKDWKKLSDEFAKPVKDAIGMTPQRNQKTKDLVKLPITAAVEVQ